MSDSKTASSPSTRVLFRKLSLRSRLGFGKYAFAAVSRDDEPTVGDILDKPDGHEYLLWVYYHKDNIDFLPEVLERLDAPALIAKPGRAPELFESVRDGQKEREKARRAALTPEQREQEDDLRRKRIRKAQHFQRLCEAVYVNGNARYFQAVNHGHIAAPTPKSIYSK